MTVKELNEWLKDKPPESEVINNLTWKPLNFEEIGLIHKDKIRIDPNGEQGELF